MAAASLAGEPAALIARSSASMGGASHIVIPTVNTVRASRTPRPVNNGWMAFHDNLKRLRIRAQLSQEQVALAFGKAGQSTIGNYEAGKREPKASEIPALARAVNASVGELLGVEEASQPMGPDPDKLADLIEALEAAAIQARREIPPRTKARLVASLYASNANRETVKAALASILATLED
jgi:transcriptional regulator with XRE-family HTH domain